MTRRSRFTASRRAALGLLGAGAPLLAPAPARASAAAEALTAFLVTNWAAQAEHGGFMKCRRPGFTAGAGLARWSSARAGRQANPAQLLLGGRVDMSMGNGVTALNFVQQDLPFLCIGAVFQKVHGGCAARASRHRLHRVRGAARADDLISAEPRATWWPFSGENGRGMQAPALHLLHAALPRPPDARAAGHSGSRGPSRCAPLASSPTSSCCTTPASKTTARPNLTKYRT